MKHILFVDDEPSLLDGLRRNLRQYRSEWDMRFATSGQAALALMAEEPCDVIVTDMRMPGMDGGALLELVCQRHPSVVRIVLSGYCDVEAAIRVVPVAHQFLQKPCEPSRLRQAIDRACRLIAVLKDETTRRIVGTLRGLPSVPQVVSQLLAAIENPDAGVDELSRIIERDVAISAKVIQLANSAFFGRSREITSIRGGVSFLGVDVLKQLVLTAGIFRAFRPGSAVAGFSLERFQAHAHLVARIASRLPIAQASASIAAVAALLHDTGQLVVASRLPQQFAELQGEAKRTRTPLHSVEQQHLGFTHADIGAYLLGLWGLPEEVVCAVLQHHRTSRDETPGSPFDVSAAVYFANILAHLGPDGPFSEFDREYARASGVEPELEDWRRLAVACGEEEE